MLDRESVPHYWLSVYARDMGTEPLLSWTHVFLELLDVNDNAPEFSQPIYFASVLENVSKDKSVVKVTATDMDSSSEGKLTFQMLDLQRTYFNIDSNSGNFLCQRNHKQLIVYYYPNGKYVFTLLALKMVFLSDEHLSL